MMLLFEVHALFLIQCWIVVVVLFVVVVFCCLPQSDTIDYFFPIKEMSKTAYNEAQALTKSTMQKTKAQSLPTTQIAFR